MKIRAPGSLVAVIIVSGAVLTTAQLSTVAGAPSCGDRAQWLYPYDKRARKACKQACNDRRSAWKDARKAFRKAYKRGVSIGY